MMKSRGRPRVAEVQLKDGFYIEVCNKGTKKGMKIRSNSLEAMNLATAQTEFQLFDRSRRELERILQLLYRIQ